MNLIVIRTRSTTSSHTTILILNRPVSQTTLVAQNRWYQISQRRTTHLVRRISHLPVHLTLDTTGTGATGRSNQLTVITRPRARNIQEVGGRLHQFRPRRLLKHHRVRDGITLTKLLIRRLTNSTHQIKGHIPSRRSTPATVRDSQHHIRLTTVLNRTYLRTFMEEYLATRRTLTVDHNIKFRQSSSLFTRPRIRHNRLPRLKTTRQNRLPLQVNRRTIGRNQIRRTTVLA